MALIAFAERGDSSLRAASLNANIDAVRELLGVSEVAENVRSPKDCLAILHAGCWGPAFDVAADSIVELAIACFSKCKSETVRASFVRELEAALCALHVVNVIPARVWHVRQLSLSQRTYEHVLAVPGINVNAHLPGFVAAGAPCTLTTPVVAALQFGHTEGAKLLLAAGADLPAEAASGALHEACVFGDEGIVCLLLSLFVFTRRQLRRGRDVAQKLLDAWAALS
jgi:hypothetical protein